MVLPWVPGLDVSVLISWTFKPVLGLQKLVIVLNLRRNLACQGNIYRIQ
jgi:hypothetical protein